jgi:thiol:disulfide interchange protein
MSTFSRRPFVLGLAMLPMLALAVPAYAFEPKPYSAAALAAAQATGKPILVEVHADWCPTCRAQTATLGKLAADARFKDFVVLRVDFDSQKDDVRKLNARSQSTLIVYRGTQERGRVVGDAGEASLNALLTKAL